MGYRSSKSSYSLSYIFILSIYKQASTGGPPWGEWQEWNDCGRIARVLWRGLSGCDQQQVSYFGLMFIINIPKKRYNDGVQWHDVPCFFRAKIICEDSEKQMRRIFRETGVDVHTPTNGTSQWKSLPRYFVSAGRAKSEDLFHLFWMSPKLTSEFCIRQNFLLVVPPSLTQNSIKLLLIFQCVSQQLHKNMFSKFQISWNSTCHDPKKKSCFCDDSMQCRSSWKLSRSPLLSPDFEIPKYKFSEYWDCQTQEPIAKSQHQQRN